MVAIFPVVPVVRAGSPIRIDARIKDLVFCQELVFGWLGSSEASPQNSRWAHVVRPQPPEPKTKLRWNARLKDDRLKTSLGNILKVRSAR